MSSGGKSKSVYRKSLPREGPQRQIKEGFCLDVTASEGEEENDLEIHFPGLNNQLIHELLDYHAERGDVQTCVMLVLVLGEHIQPPVKKIRVQQWLCSYIDLLQRLQLFSVAARIVSTCGDEYVQASYQMTSVIQMMCINQNCRNQFVQVHPNFKGLCPMCAQMLSKCSICQEPVRSVYVWCQGCGHGGHLSHIYDWFRVEETCPTGCGHRCNLKNVIMNSS
mmetsp:Transcript_10834/g.12422  ORF Transcript_10834/g.12422 Transcript_10834/m.12422 type:complete len:222 (-) Transcript_10834:195-860(-)